MIHPTRVGKAESVLQEHDGCDYVIALQEGPGLEQLNPLPKLPPNARFVHHENKCFDLGTVGWMLETQVKNPRQALDSLAVLNKGSTLYQRHRSVIYVYVFACFLKKTSGNSSKLTAVCTAASTDTSSG